jgi:spore cortex formation protein SpoVR/YcgB (stage V sporulation)
MVLDAAHALAPHGVDKFKRKHKPKLNEELRLKKLIDDENRQQAELDIVLKKTSFRDTEIEDAEVDDTEDEENLLYFIMKKSPNLEQWKREIIRIVYKINQYFYPQGQTQNLNEGFASFTHYYIMTRLEEKGILSSDAFIAFLDSHAGVLYQPEYNKRWYSGINPYALGFNILMDVKRICEKPTEEDRDWFPHLIGKRWQDAIKEAVFEHRDDSFIMQYLSPNVIRKMGLFSVNVTEDLENFEGQKAVVSDIHDEAGYKQIRINLARSYERINRVPQIAVTGADLEGDRTLYLEYIPYMGRKLDRETAESVADYIDFLWGYPVELDDGEPDED